MRAPSKFMALIYFIMGILFTYFAIQNNQESGWNILTFIFAAIATLDFGVVIRFINDNYFSNKGDEKK